MSIRCAVCGSKRVTTEVKKEGYNMGKGVVGAALFGVPGAMAGWDGNEVTYYHCADCGQVMNKPMLQAASEWIDYLIENQNSYAMTLDNSALKNEKKRYINIEWEENSCTTAKDNEFSEIQNNELSQLEIQKQLILKKFETSPIIHMDEFSPDLKDPLWLIKSDAFMELRFNGRIVTELIDGEEYCRLPKDINESKNIILEFRMMKRIDEDVTKNLIEMLTRFSDCIEDDREYSKEEFENVLMEVFSHMFDLSNSKWLEMLSDRFRLSLSDFEMLLSEWESETYKFKKYRNALEETKEQILQFLNKKLEFVNMLYIEARGAKDIALKELVAENKVEVKEVDGDSLYAIAGLRNLLKEKAEKEKAEKEEKIRKQILQIEDALKNLEDKYNQELKKLEDNIEEQKKVFNDNKNKLFGNGAKVKKKAKAAIDCYTNMIWSVKSEYQSKHNELIERKANLK